MAIQHRLSKYCSNSLSCFTARLWHLSSALPKVILQRRRCRVFKKYNFLPNEDSYRDPCVTQALHAKFRHRTSCGFGVYRVNTLTQLSLIIQMNGCNIIFSQSDHSYSIPIIVTVCQLFLWMLNVYWCMWCELGELYTSELDGSDECGDGTEQKPFKTILQVGVSVQELFSIVCMVCSLITSSG